MRINPPFTKEEVRIYKKVQSWIEKEEKKRQEERMDTALRSLATLNRGK